MIRIPLVCALAICFADIPCPASAAAQESKSDANSAEARTSPQRNAESGADADGPGRASDEQRYWLRVDTDKLNLRARPDANSIVVAAVARDELLRGTGEQFGWHTVLPPNGVFSLVSAEYVDRQGDDKGIVRVDSGKLRVRVGSREIGRDPLLNEVQSLLPNGAEVEILGEHNGWFMIVPPPDVRLHVSAEHVERIGEEDARARGLHPADFAPRRGKPNQESDAPAEAASSARADAAVEHAADVQESNPSRPGASDLRGDWGQRLTMIETAIEAEARKPVEQRSWSDLLADLQPVAEQRLERAAARLAQEWVRTLKDRMADERALLAAQEIARAAERDAALFDRETRQIARAREAERKAENYQALGELLPANIPPGQAGRVRYMLRNPLTLKVVVYLETPEDFAATSKDLLGRYVGVRGERQRSAALQAEVLRVREIVRVQKINATPVTTRGER